MATTLFVFKKAKNGTFAEKRMELDPQTHIDLQSVSPEEHHAHICMATPLSVFKKKPKMVLLSEKRMGLQA